MVKQDILTTDDIENAFALLKRGRSKRLKRFIFRFRQIEFVQRHQVRNIERSVVRIYVLILEL